MTTTNSQPRIVATGHIDEARNVRFDKIDENFYPTTPYEMSEARQLWRDLVAKWTAQGMVLYVTGKEVDACWNEHQEAGWNQARRDWYRALDNMTFRPMPERDLDPDEADDSPYTPTALDFSTDW